MLELAAQFESAWCHNYVQLCKVVGSVMDPISLLDKNPNLISEIQYLQVARVKPELAAINGVLRNYKDQILIKFSSSTGVKYSNEDGTLAILQALRMYMCSFQEILMVECNLSNDTSRALGVVGVLGSSIILTKSRSSSGTVLGQQMMWLTNWPRGGFCANSSNSQTT